MRNVSAFHALAVVLALIGMCVPQVAFCASPTAPAIMDVRLQEGGVLLGQVVDSQGVGLVGVKVSLQSNGQELAVGATADKGLFAFSGLTRGSYQVVAGNGFGAVRVWTAQTAPPAAQAGIVLVANQEVVRGQRPAGELLTHPLVLGGILATAIAVPIAVATNNHHASP